MRIMRLGNGYEWVEVSLKYIQDYEYASKLF